jgi:D-glycero-alpha-D-manno-heptose-7-phosphate kinase
MLIARTPMRISFGGAGTDFEAYYAKYGGVAISATINKYFYAILTPTKTDDLQLISTDYRSPFRHMPSKGLLSDSNLALPRAVLDHFGVRHGLNLFLANEVPSGAGLGSSGAAAVTMVHAISALVKQSMTKLQIAETASCIEIDHMKMPIGKHDFYASAFGGLNKITFTNEGTTVEPLRISHVAQKMLESRLMLFFTGSFHEFASTLKHRPESVEEHNDKLLPILHDIKSVTINMQSSLERGALDEFAQLLDYCWQQKHYLAPNLSVPSIDEWYKLARQHGALGGKIVGGGGGGFLLLYCHEEAQDKVTSELEEQGLKRMKFLFDHQGAIIVLLNITSFSNLKTASCAK